MANPIRLSEKLIEQAEKSCDSNFRTAPKQIEFWATIGKEVTQTLTPADLAALANGEVEVHLVRKKSAPVSMDAVFAEIENDRSNHSLHSKVVRENVWYEESPEHKGYLVRFDSSANRKDLGPFIDGKFRVQWPNAAKINLSSRRR